MLEWLLQRPCVHSSGHVLTQMRTRMCCTGMRARPGVVPQDNDVALLRDRSQPAWRLQSLSGVMGRSVADVALAMDAAVGVSDADAM